jgi:hypothetical protein
MRAKTLCLCLLVAGFSPGAYAASGPVTALTVRQLNVKLMQSRKLIGKVVATLQRGEHVEVLTDEHKAGWWKVKTSRGEVGWVVASAVAEGKIVLSKVPGGDDARVSTEEAALAGRGFNKNVEKEYATENQKLDFDEIDRIEAVQVDPESAESFERAGKLGGKR